MFALCAQDRVRADGYFASPAFQLVLVFVGCIIFPATLYVYLAHPAWAWMYAFDPSVVPGFMIGFVLLLAGGGVVGGWLGGCKLIRQGRGDLVKYLVLGTALATALVTAIFHTRLGSSGSYQDFAVGRALELHKAKLAYVLLVLGLGVCSAAGYVGVVLSRDSRKVRSRRSTAVGDIL